MRLNDRGSLLRDSYPPQDRNAQHISRPCGRAVPRHGLSHFHFKGEEMADEFADPDLDDSSSAGGESVSAGSPADSPEQSSAPESESSSSSKPEAASSDDKSSQYDFGDFDDEGDDVSSSSEADDNEPAAPAVDAEAKQDAEAEPSSDESPADKKSPTAPKLDGDIDDDAIEMASRYGFDADEARAFGSRKNLEITLAALDRRAAKSVRDQMAASKPADDPATDAGTTTDSSLAEPNDVNEKGGFEKFNVNLDPELFDEETINVVSGLNDHYDAVARAQHEELQALRQQLSSVVGNQRAEQAKRFSQDMDAFFTGLGEGFREQYGTGGMAAIPANSPARIARQRFVEEMSALQIADQRLGRSSTLSELQERAKRVLHGAEIEQQARKGIAAEVDKRRHQSISRPTSRTTRPLNGEQRAGAFANKFYADRGADKDDSYDGEL